MAVSMTDVQPFERINVNELGSVSMSTAITPLQCCSFISPVDAGPASKLTAFTNCIPYIAILGAVTIDNAVPTFIHSGPCTPKDYAVDLHFVMRTSHLAVHCDRFCVEMAVLNDAWSGHKIDGRTHCVSSCRPSQ